MVISPRVASWALVVVASALTITGVVVAATDTSPMGNVKDPLALNGYPPKSADLHFVISTGQAYNVSADVNVNFVTDAVEANVQFPMFFSSANVDLRLVNHHLYAGMANLKNLLGASWIAMPSGQPSLFGISLEMTKPDISLISGFTTETISTSGYSTTYSYYRKNATITTPKGFPMALPTRAAITFTLTTGKQGELTATSFTVKSKKSTASISATVLSYNQQARIVAPPARDVKKVTSSFLRQIFGSSSVGSFLNPKNVASLGQIRLS